VSEAGGPAIQVRDVRKDFKLYQRRETTLKATILSGRRTRYERFNAVDGVSFEVRRGEVLGIIGRNGSGKSTLLKLLARILEPDGGSVTMDGRVSALLEVGAGFHQEYSAIENIFLSGAIYGVSRAALERRVDDIIRFAELERFAENPVKTYSSGMFARLGFAIAINVDPDILLVDEVLAVGDQSFQARCLDRMLEFRDAGKTIVFVTHDLSSVEAFCDRAIWMDQGRVRDDGLPHHVIRSYVTEVNAGDIVWNAEDVRSRGAAAAEHAPLNPSAPASLQRMSFLDEAGIEQEMFPNGGPMRIQVHYRAHEPIRAPVCEIRIDNQHQVHVTTVSNRIGGLQLEGDVPVGDAFFEWTIEDLALTPGTYYFSPRLLDHTGAAIYDQHETWYRLRVHAGGYHERHGVAILPGSWRHALSPGERSSVVEPV
jgi:ABC-type polysaccharide/polyol phosphate transport system ATPase subunit